MINIIDKSMTYKLGDGYLFLTYFYLLARELIHDVSGMMMAIIIAAGMAGGAGRRSAGWPVDGMGNVIYH